MNVSRPPARPKRNRWRNFLKTKLTRFRHTLKWEWWSRWWWHNFIALSKTTVRRQTQHWNAFMSMLRNGWTNSLIVVLSIASWQISTENDTRDLKICSNKNFFFGFWFGFWGKRLRQNSAYNFFIDSTLHDNHLLLKYFIWIHQTVQCFM